MATEFEIKLGSETLLVMATPLIDDGYIEIEAVDYRGTDIWPVLAECEEMAGQIEKRVEEKIPGFSAMCANAHWKAQDEAMFKHGR